MTKIDFTRDAERDLINIFLYGTDHFGAGQAERYLNSINAKIDIARSTWILGRTTAVSSGVFADTRQGPTLYTTAPRGQVFSCCVSCTAGWIQPVTWLDLKNSG